MASQASSTDEEEVDYLDELNETLPASFSITAYGADYPVDGLVKRINQGDIVIPRFNSDPANGQSTVGFQREYVWRKPQAERFVELLLLGLPVPGIFFGKRAKWEAVGARRSAATKYHGQFLWRPLSRERVRA